MNVRKLVANVVVFTVDWVLIVGWIVTSLILLVSALIAGVVGASDVAGITLGATFVWFIYFSLATGVWFLLGMVLDCLKDIQKIFNEES